MLVVRLGFVVVVIGLSVLVGLRRLVYVDVVLLVVMRVYIV